MRIGLASNVGEALNLLAKCFRDLLPPRHVGRFERIRSFAQQIANYLR